MLCPICDHSVDEDVLRCPQCGKALTVWKNLDMFAERAYTTALQCHRSGAAALATEMFLRAVVLAPHNSRYLFTLGCSLAQQRRYLEAVDVLEKSQRLEPCERTAAALAKAQQLEEEARECEPE